MSSIDLTLLGLLYESPQSAYDIQKAIEYRNISKWMKISGPSVYKKVIKLEGKGYLKGVLSKESNMPEKIIYSITDSGKAYFQELMEKISLTPVQILFDFNAVIVNINKLPKKEALVILDNIEESIDINRGYIKMMAAQRMHIPLVGRTIIEQQINIFDELYEWICGFKKEYEVE